ncbi:MAG: Si-specific NAD(P)(+) transhydrogenase [Ectothiorhodospiraceae bacterium]|nr:Si-specific NAD(P)(+) transhydrogenase [Ectothiorhodospiraceae bacterium]
MIEKKYDVLVIGSGPGGEGAAMKLAKSGKHVAIIEKNLKVGGNCTHVATIPSKTLINVVRQLTDLRRNPLFLKVARRVNISWEEIMHEVEVVVNKQVQERQGFYDRNDVDVLEGNAAFHDHDTVKIVDPEGIEKFYTGDAIIIATGARPYRPPDVPFEVPRVVDSDTILELGFIPKTVTIYGAGVIGCEYASAFRGLNTKVNLVNTRDQLLSFLDDEISDALSYHLREQGVIIRNNEEYENVEIHGDRVVLHLASGTKVKSDVLLWANGRSGNSAGLNLESLGIEPDHRGNIPVNENYQTSVPNIYAIGDVIGYPSLSSAAYDQGRLAATHIIEGKAEFRLVQDIPTGIYTNPEISSVGKTERELTLEKIPFEVGHAFFRNLARSQISGHEVGVLKLLFSPTTLEILGVHCFGPQSSEIVHIGQAIMSQKNGGNNIKYFVKTTFNYPTMAESYRVAALNGLNRLFQYEEQT